MLMRLRSIAASLTFCLLPVLCVAQTLRPSKPAIASAHPLASQAGLQILQEGGNAFDAAVAVAAALAVVEPSSSGVGGGGLWLLHRESDQFETMVDSRETAPAAATRDMFLDKAGNPIEGLSTNSALAAGIPGEPAGFVWLAEKYGKLPLKQSLAPAIKLAREGFPIYARLRSAIEFKRDVFAKSDAGRIWLVKGAVPEVGTVIHQAELARTLQLLADKGAAGFYQGEVARRMVDGVRKLGGNWTLADLQNYAVKERKPLVGEYRGARIVSAPPPSSGGIALIDALNILSGYNLHAVDSLTRKHLILQAMQRVHRDRAQYLGDPDFVKVPLDLLTSPAYAAGQRTSIRMDRAMPSDQLPGIETPPPGPQTTHFSVLDTEGNRVGATITVNFSFGSGLMAPGTGVFLNNEMDDFSIKPGVPNGFQLVGAEANSIAPGKRMLSSMTPTFVEGKDGVMIIGSPGGSFITGMVLLGTLEYLDGHSAQEVVSLPRYHHQYLPDIVMYEKNALSSDEQAGLEKRGHKLRMMSGTYGNMQVVTWDYRTGATTAVSDPRGAGGGTMY